MAYAKLQDHRNLEAKRRWYRDNKERVLFNNSRSRKEIRQQLSEIKENTPCEDCKHFYPAFVMEFDHVRGDKKFDIGSGMASGIHIIMKEVAKCDIVCANCHRIRTHKRK